MDCIYHKSSTAFNNLKGHSPVGMLYLKHSLRTSCCKHTKSDIRKILKSNCWTPLIKHRQGQRADLDLTEDNKTKMRKGSQSDFAFWPVAKLGKARSGHHKQSQFAWSAFPSTSTLITAESKSNVNGNAKLIQSKSKRICGHQNLWGWKNIPWNNSCFSAM